MVKATGGGGGIGMLACHDAGEVADAFARVQRLAAANFGAAGVFLERLVRPARHVEVQVFGDGTGQVVVLGDRDCSLQRRNQKVIEEAPAPGLPPTLRAGCTRRRGSWPRPSRTGRPARSSSCTTRSGRRRRSWR